MKPPRKRDPRMSVAAEPSHRDRPWVNPNAGRWRKRAPKFKTAAQREAYAARVEENKAFMQKAAPWFV